MNNIKEFDGPSNLRSLLNFWLATAPMLAGVLLLTTVVIIWKRKWAIDLRSRAWRKLGWSSRREKESRDIENRASSAPSSQTLHSPSPSTSYHPPPTLQPSGAERGERISMETFSPRQPPPSPSPQQFSSQQQQYPSAVYSTSTTSTKFPDGSSLRLPSTEKLSTSPLVPNS